jgi:hypothetical protein
VDVAAGAAVAAGTERMATNRPSVNKRNREQAKREKQQEKAARRAERARSRQSREGGDGEDPDLAGIVPGPQPPTEE